MEERNNKWELLPNLWIGTMKSYLQLKRFLDPENTQEILKSWTPISFQGQVQNLKAYLKNKQMLSEDQNKELSQRKENTPMEAPQASTSAKKEKKSPKDQPEGKSKGNLKGKVQVEQTLPSKLQNSKEMKYRHGECVQYYKEFDGIKSQGGENN
ncbi:hypothetical protein O181_002537 [Austropuccinia psidii MF-1]|uniref:Uncharacterized protein n=1 Tax=Austropuccinia psidii MF-1 TaxID=1389203 RepID=A0A9Q3GE23_9BASI|nr:hypothetical protein [Austropuccinia psidii MF-1]